jgi:nucleoside-diphosphate-sugar epimerase
MEFAITDLTNAEGWTEAVEGCDGVFHVASPVPTIQPKDAAGIIEQARQGTLNVLSAAQTTGIKRVVLTSSVAAVMGSKKVSEYTYTSDDWSDPQDPDLNPYAASKTIAEKEAWDFIEQNQKQGSNLTELAVINPGMVLGPALEADYGSSLEILYKLLTGGVPLVPKIGAEIVDVRDVASLHRLAFEHSEAAGQRFLCGAGFRWFIEIAKLLHKEFPENKKIPLSLMPGFLTGFFAIFIREMSSIIDDLDAVKKMDCTPALDLGWHPRSPEEAVIAGGKSLIDLGVV